MDVNGQPTGGTAAGAPGIPAGSIPGNMTPAQYRESWLKVMTAGEPGPRGVPIAAHVQVLLYHDHFIQVESSALHLDFSIMVLRRALTYLEDQKLAGLVLATVQAARQPPLIVAP